MISEVNVLSFMKYKFKKEYFFLISIVLMIILFFVLKNNKSNDYLVLEGFAQGTTYRIIYSHPEKINFKESIDSILQVIDSTLSIYNKNSIISKLNNENKDTIIIRNKHLHYLLDLSFRIHKITNGSFDITLQPLINAYGFGPDKKVKNLDPNIIDSLMDFVGMNKILVKDSVLIKKNKNLKIDLNAIAQGYTCDIIADFFDKKGIKNYLIEVGGEIKTKGKNPKRSRWSIGIDKPDENNLIPGQNIKSILYISNISLATSGNYRKFLIENGEKYAHIINPRTGYPAKTDILSVTVLHDTCAIADALATAFIVLGFDSTVKFLKDNSQIQAYIIYVDKENSIKTWVSEKIKRYLIEVQ